MTENKMFAIIWSSLFICTALTIIFASLNYHKHVEKMAELGYEEGVVQGVRGTVWVKAK